MILQSSSLQGGLYHTVNLPDIVDIDIVAGSLDCPLSKVGFDHNVVTSLSFLNFCVTALIDDVIMKYHFKRINLQAGRFLRWGIFLMIFEVL